MEIYRVTPEDLKDSLYGIPIEIVQKMVERQFEQTGKCDISVFQNHYSQCQEHGGFTWELSPEGDEFWRQILVGKKYEIFFYKYPETISYIEEDV